MKATLMYDTSEPSESKELEKAVKAPHMAIALWDIERMLRELVKYEDILHKGYLTEEEDKVVEFISGKFHEILEDNNIEFVLTGD
jgi:hypothetical protein